MCRIKAHRPFYFLVDVLPLQAEFSDFSPMIYAKDRGQMCNNLLQFGHVYAWARSRGRRAISMRLAYKYPYFRASTMPGHNFARYLWGKYAPKLRLMPTVDFDSPDADPQFLEAEMDRHANIRVEGWNVRFYDLFERYLPEIREMFAFRPEVRREAAKRMEGTDGMLRVGLHVRRGDYALWHDGRFFFSHEQYAAVGARTIAAIAEGRPTALFICTNDSALPIETYRAALPGVEVRLCHGNPGEDLCVLSECDMLVGPPSTFSLVAAMQRDIPLYWIKDPDATPSAEDFRKFNYLFRHIL